MEKKYQVFISSTYIDLVDERKEVIQALLELDCIPVGMELFPAANEDQWTLIKELIDTCDYYILIVGGRYGSMNSEGISYTQMEYEYALEKKIPIVSFIPKEPDKIAVGKTDQDEEKAKKLENFLKLVQSKMCKHYSNPIELGSVASRSIVKLTKRHPAIGWIRGNIKTYDEASAELNELNNKIKSLESELENVRIKPPIDTENLQQGEDEIELGINVLFRDSESDSFFPTTVAHPTKIKITWNKLFYVISPRLIDEDSERVIKSVLANQIELDFKDKIRAIIEENLENKYEGLNIDGEDFQTVKVQLKALGLITESIKKRSLNDNDNYWSLTPYGNNAMYKLRALRK